MKDRPEIVLNTGVGGSAVVANTLANHLNADILKLSENERPKGTGFLIATQPKALLYCFRFLNNRSVHFILDLHPGALNLYKRSLYYVIILILWLFARRRTFIPKGPLSSQFLFKDFVIVDWSIFVKNKFNGEVSKTQEFVYVGPTLRHKGFLKFTNLVSDLEKKIVKCYSNQLDHGNIYFFWGELESYGLLWRELVAGGYNVVCHRWPIKEDDIKNGIYLLSDNLVKSDAELFTWYNRNFPSTVVKAKDDIPDAFNFKSL